MAGFFDLQSPNDLLQKLKTDFIKIEEKPRDVYIAYNFFATAENLVDWVNPGKGNREIRENERDNEILLQITSHLATGIKHFKPEAKCHNSVKDTKKIGGTFSAHTFAANTFKANSFSKGNLFIELQGEAEKQLGSPITAIELARKVLDYWQTRLETVSE